jgi:hypothetical protein
MAPLKQKGDLAELMVAADLRKRGFLLLIPWGEDSNYDLAIDRGDRIERVQVKHATSDGKVVPVRCTSYSLTNGKVKQVKHYTQDMIDWLAIWDSTTERCFYIPAKVLGQGRTRLHLRLVPPSYNRRKDIRMAEEYETLG